MFKLFARYVLVGGVNTVIHWAVFFALHYFLSFNQSMSNLNAFIVAVTFSFFANARFTFDSIATKWRYLSFIIFMGCLSILSGWIADKQHIYPVVTLVTFSAISLIFGFLYSKFIVFREVK